MTCSKFPAQLTAGLNLRAALDLADYPAPTWAVSAVLRGPASIDLTATGSGTVHTFSADPTATAAWAPGRYWFSLRAKSGADVVEIERGQLDIVPDLASAAAGFDGRTDNEKALEAINAVLGQRATKDQERYRINNRELWRMPVADLLKLRAFYATQVRHERAKASGVSTFGRKILVRFSQ